MYLSQNIRKRFSIGIEDEKKFKNAKICWICENELGDDKVRDHDHLSGAFRGAAHNECNLSYRMPKRIPIYFHNLKNYDGHLMIKGMDSKIFAKNFIIIPQTITKYIG